MQRASWILAVCFLATSLTWARGKAPEVSNSTIKTVSIKSTQDSIRMKLQISNGSSQGYYIAVCDSPTRLSELYSRLQIEVHGNWQSSSSFGNSSLDEITPWWLQVPAGGMVEVDLVFSPALDGIEPGTNTRLALAARRQPPTGNDRRAPADFEIVSPVFPVASTSNLTNFRTHSTGLH